MAVQVNRLFHQSIADVKEEAQILIDTCDSWKGFDLEWSFEYPMTIRFDRGNPIPMGSYTDQMGVYLIFYDGEVLYVGNGKVWKRISTHGNQYSKIVLYGGVEEWRKRYPGQTRAGHECARKMFEYDPDGLHNWSFKVCVIGDKTIAKKYESKLIKEYDPSFNVKGEENI
tara:strand:- start:56 stop:565 length:510 start_codon:yes stop_codon:yes gene_type:complete